METNENYERELLHVKYQNIMYPFFDFIEYSLNS